MAKVIIYSAEWCPWCRLAKQWLTKNKIKYNEIDVDETPSAADELVKKTGQTGIPVIEIDGKTVIGFNEPELRKLLKIK